VKTIKPENIDEYISDFPAEIQKLLSEVRTTIRKAAPAAKELISYQMPAFRQNSVLVYFAAFKKHIGFFPTMSGIAAFKEELSVYKGAKGSVQFPFEKPMPLDLISRIVKFRVAEDEAKAEAKVKVKVKAKAKKK
jgi:uncharacterized protein YdhG (YjbR/CyaY superfamily)